MAEGGSEIEKGSLITVKTVLQGIEQTEKWWEQLQALIQQGKPVTNYISGAIEVFKQLEEAAQNPQSQLPQTAEEAAKIKALWIISAPGTYFQAYKQDRYASKPWSRWMDRQRINYALRIGRKLAEMKLRHPISNNWADAERELTEGPLVVYNGTPVENAVVLEAKKTPWLRIPEANIYPGNKIVVISPIASIDNTVDQIKSFHLPPAFEINPGDEIGVVMHAPQAVRFLYVVLANFKDAIPQGANLRIFSLPTPQGGFPEYPMQELRGTTYYHFIANPPIAAESPYPFKSLSGK